MLQYNNVYTKIGIVTIFIGLFVIAISGFIKKKKGKTRMQSTIENFISLLQKIVNTE